jgi:hypothetical protein
LGVGGWEVGVGVGCLRVGVVWCGVVWCGVVWGGVGAKHSRVQQASKVLQRRQRPRWCPAGLSSSSVAERHSAPMQAAAHPCTRRARRVHTTCAQHPPANLLLILHNEFQDDLQQQPPLRKAAAPPLGARRLGSTHQAAHLGSTHGGHVAQQLPGAGVVAGDGRLAGRGLAGGAPRAGGRRCIPGCSSNSSRVAGGADGMSQRGRLHRQQQALRKQQRIKISSHSD